VTVGETKAGLARANVLLLHLVGVGRNLPAVRTPLACLKSARWKRAYQTAKREATKHVDSFGVGFWIRVQFSAPPPILSTDYADYAE